MSSQGYYSLLQYSEYPERIEFVNIGVVLFADVPPHSLVRFSKNARRVEQLFDVNLNQHFSLLKESMESRIATEFFDSWSREKVERFISVRAGKIRLSPLRSVAIKDHRETLNELFERLVGDESKSRRRPQARTKLKNQFERNGVFELLDQPDPVRLPQGVTIKAHYGYQNGSYNLINAVSLREDPDLALENASKYAIEGQWLSKLQSSDGTKRLIVVGDLDGQQHNFVSAVGQMMQEHDVDFYEMEHIAPLIDDIKKSTISH